LANARCRGEHSDELVKRATKNIYVVRVEPLNYPSSSVICGRKNCINPALIHLSEKEWQEYRQGVRIFEPHTQAVKIRVSEKVETIS
jgi:hypothetical protein